MWDLRPCSPVVKGGKRQDTVSDSTSNGKSWPCDREKELLDYASLLLKLGNGTL